MKMTITLAAAAVLSAAVATAGSADDSLISFSTIGPDRYADGSTVLDGECYALVWSKDGKFEGFSADGKPLDAADRVILVGELAEGGRCPEVLFQVPADLAAKLAGGYYAVYLLDTRVAAADSGAAVRPKGVDNGVVRLVNGYGKAAASIALPGAMSRRSLAEMPSANGQVAGTVASAPANIKQPRIKNIRLDGDRILLTVENLEGYMRVHGGSKVGEYETSGFAKPTTGKTDEIVLDAPKLGDAGFYRVIRN